MSQHEGPHQRRPDGHQRRPDPNQPVPDPDQPPLDPRAQDEEQSLWDAYWERFRCQQVDDPVTRRRPR